MQLPRDPLARRVEIIMSFEAHKKLLEAKANNIPIRILIAPPKKQKDITPAPK